MNFKMYLQSLLPSFEKDRILEDCRLTRNELKEFTIPAYENALPLLKGWKFKNEELEEQFKRFDRMVKPAGNGNIVVSIHAGFKNLLDNLNVIEGLVQKTYSEEVAGAGITYMKANLLQFAECAYFVTKYARKYLIYLYVVETAQFQDSGTSIEENLTPSDREWLKANFVNFCTAFEVVTTEHGNVTKRLSNIPEIAVTTENADTLQHTLGLDKVDPFRMSFIPVWLNPIYHLGLFVAEWQATRYKEAKEELRLLQFRRLNLERQREGKRDAHLEKEISITEDRIQDLTFKLNKMEKDAGL